MRSPFSYSAGSVECEWLPSKEATSRLQKQQQQRNSPSLAVPVLLNYHPKHSPGCSVETQESQSGCDVRCGSCQGGLLELDEDKQEVP